IVLRTGQKFAFGLAGGLFMLSVSSICGLPKFAPVFEQSSHGQKPSGGLRPLLFKYRRPFRHNHRLKAYFCIFGFVLLGGGVLNIGLPILFKTDFGGNIADWGMIMSGFQAGSCLATFLLPRCSSTLMHQTIFSSSFLALTGAMAILGHLTTYIQVALLMILFGCGLTLMHIFLESLIQQNSEQMHMGKTMSLLTTYRGACYLGTILTSALVLRVWSPQLLLLAGSCLMALASFLAQRLVHASPSCNNMKPNTRCSPGIFR
ncbi:MAG TPA: MFS transporter, partial [Desulfobacterales bacterium]|nr:MFS transporter [Desulfobacterales bacterium]